MYLEKIEAWKKEWHFRNYFPLWFCWISLSLSALPSSLYKVLINKFHEWKLWRKKSYLKIKLVGMVTLRSINLHHSKEQNANSIEHPLSCYLVNCIPVCISKALHRGVFCQSSFQWFTTIAVINPLEKKLANCTSVYWLEGLSPESI